MKKIILKSIFVLLSIQSMYAQNVGISGGFFASMVSVNEESTLTITLSNEDFFLSVMPNGAYVQIDFPTTGEYTPITPPYGAGSSFITWTFNAPNIWTGFISQEIPPLTSVTFSFDVMAENITPNTATLLFTDLISGSDSNAQNNNAAPLLSIQQSLPVELIDFDVRAIDCEKVSLDWSTASEINNSGFEILMSSDGKKFEQIGFAKGNVNSYTIQNYSFDYRLSGVSSDEDIYFRLKQVDLNGSFALSDIIRYTKDCESLHLALNVSPNPTSGLLNFQFDNSLDSDASVVILNSNNQVVDRFEISKNESNFRKNLSHLTRGIYFIKTISNEQEFNHKIVLLD